MTRGQLITLEGIDGSGTTTQRDRLTSALETMGFRVHTTFEPTDGVIGRMIRDALKGKISCSPHALALLFAADRLYHLQHEIEPHLARGEWVISDRYLLSSLVYQSLDCPLDWVAEINRYAPMPDHTFLLDLDPALAGERRKSRGQAPDHFEQDDLQIKLAQRYRESLDPNASLAQLLPLGKITRIDASQTPSQVTQSILSALKFERKSE
jgi:dTMP kinase